MKILIPGSAAHEIDYSLSVAGIDEITIFPDLDGLGRWLAIVLLDESRAWLGFLQGFGPCAFELLE